MYMLTYASAGCLPDDGPHVFETPRLAWQHVADEIELIPDDGDYLEAHTALHVIDRDDEGSIPGPGLYAWRVERIECVCPDEYRARGWEAANCDAHPGEDN